MGHDEPDYDANNPLVRISQPQAEEEYLTDAFAREACNFIERYQSTPFLLTVTFNAVHSPLQAKNSTLQAFSSIEDIHRRIFAAMLSDLDQGVGRIVACLEELRLRENTIIVFLSDNGGPTKELTSSNLPLRAGKGSMYEGGLRVPFIVNWPGNLPASGVCTEVVSSLDIFPTVVELAGASRPDNLDGHDIMPLLSDPQRQSEHEFLYWRQGGRAAYRRGPWKAVSPKMRSGDRSWELYNIDSDIGETRDLAADQPDLLNELVQQWKQLDAQMQAPLFGQ
jgi:arylsulfatase B